MRRVISIFLFLLLGPSIVHSQERAIQGRVVDKNTDAPLEGVSIYYDGTTIGTITDREGYFTIYKGSSLTAPLVVSYIGYGKKILDTSSEDLEVIFLEEEILELDEVVLLPDTWSREKKMSVFRSEFLGKIKESLDCKILNEKAIRLYYNKNEEVLYAYANEPLIISNKHLGYRLTFDLTNFEVKFNTNLSGLRMVYSSYFSGTTFFSEMNKKIKRKYVKNREQMYLGSILHFMRSLSKKQLTEQKFRIFKDSYEVLPYRYFEIETMNGMSKVNLKAKKLSILYDDFDQSSIQTLGAFFIDGYGNHSPIENALFGGHLSLQGIAGTLPLDYRPH